MKKLILSLIFLMSFNVSAENITICEVSVNKNSALFKSIFMLYKKLGMYKKGEGLYENNRKEIEPIDSAIMALALSNLNQEEVNFLIEKANTKCFSKYDGRWAISAQDQAVLFPRVPIYPVYLSTHFERALYLLAHAKYLLF